jgi:hypothetical protein
MSTQAQEQEPARGNMYWPHCILDEGEKHYSLLNCLTKQILREGLSWANATAQVLSLNPQDMDQREALALMQESEREEPRFEVTYTPILGGHALEVEGPFATLEEAREKSDEVYREMDLTDCEVEDHDEEWKPLNLQAKWLVADEERKKKRQKAELVEERQEPVKELGNVSLDDVARVLARLSDDRATACASAQSYYDAAEQEFNRCPLDIKFGEELADRGEELDRVRAQEEILEAVANELAILALDPMLFRRRVASLRKVCSVCGGASHGPYCAAHGKNATPMQNPALG